MRSPSSLHDFKVRLLCEISRWIIFELIIFANDIINSLDSFFLSQLYDRLRFFHEFPLWIPSHIEIAPILLIWFHFRLSLTTEYAFSRYVRRISQLRSPILFWLKSSSTRSGFHDFNHSISGVSVLSLSLLLLILRTLKLIVSFEVCSSIHDQIRFSDFFPR